MRFRAISLATASIFFSAQELAYADYNPASELNVPSVSALYNKGVAAGVSISHVQVQGIGHYDWSSSCPGTSSTIGPYFISTSSGGSGCWVLQQATTIHGQLAPIFPTVTNFTSLTGFTTNGTTPSVSGGAIVFSGGAGNFSQSLDYNWYTTLPQWTITGTITAGTPNSSSIGLGFGIRSYNTFSPENIACVPYLTSGGSFDGKVFLQDGGSISVESQKTLTFSAGDSIYLSATRNGSTITCSATDLTTESAPVTASYTYPMSYPAPAILPNRGRFAIFNFGGTQSLTSWTVTSSAQTGGVVCVGDSKTVGYYAGTYQAGWCNQIGGPLPTVIEAGGGDETADVTAVIPEIIALRPNYVLLNIGRNDLSAGSSVPTIIAAITSITNSLTAAGIQVYNVAPIYETTVNQTSLTAALIAAYPTTTITSGDASLPMMCQPWSGTASTVLAPDNIHPNGFCSLTGIAVPVQQWFAGLSGVYSFAPVATNIFDLGVTNNFTIGSLVQQESVSLNFAFGSNSAEATTGQVHVGNLAQTNDATNPFILGEYLTGDPAASNRIIDLQTGQDGSANSGILAIQRVGGRTLLGNSSDEVVTFGTLNGGNGATVTTQTYVFNSGAAQTAAGPTRVGNLSESSDASNPFALSVYQIGSATATSRTVLLQTGQDGVSNQGNISLQGSGGTVNIGGTSAPTGGIGFLVNPQTQFQTKVFAIGLTAASSGTHALCMNTSTSEIVESSSSSCP